MSRVVIVAAMLLTVGGAAHAQLIPPPIILPAPPPKNLPIQIPALPKGKQTWCNMKGPRWVLYGVHDQNGPPRHGNRYRVHAWGLTCKKARSHLRRFFPKIPPHPMGTLKGGPKGYKCKGRDAPGTVTKSEPHDGSCRRGKPAAMFDWEPTGGTVG